jgi:hypothetical protein
VTLFLVLPTLALLGCPQAESEETARESHAGEPRPLRLASDAELEAVLYAAGGSLPSLASIILSVAEIDAELGESDESPCPAMEMADDWTVSVTGGCTSERTGIAYVGAFAEKGSGPGRYVDAAMSGDLIVDPFFEFEDFAISLDGVGAMRSDGYVQWETEADGSYTLGVDIGVKVRNMPWIHSYGEVPCPDFNCGKSGLASAVEGIGPVTQGDAGTADARRVEGPVDGVELIISRGQLSMC